MSRLTIPFENARGDMSDSDRLPVLQHFIENRHVQMKYAKKAVKAGIYRKWMEQVTEEEFEGFINVNKERLQRGLEYKTFGPKLQLEYFYRNALYELELLYRHHNGEVSEELYITWREETEADLQYWKGKYEVALQNFHLKQNGAVTDDSASMTTPYY